MRRRYVSVVLLILCVVMGMTGCSSGKENDTGSDGEESSEIQIGMSFDSFVNERWLRDRDMFVSTAKELDAQVNVQIANGEVEEQIQQIEYFIKKDMDVIVIIATDGDKLKDVIDEAHRAGIKVIAYDRIISNGGADLYISFDNVRVGEMMGECLLEQLPDGGEIYQIDGPTSDYNVEMIDEGFHNVIDGSNLQVVYQINCKNWSSDLSYTYVNDALETKQDIVGVMCGNDDLANQAIMALAVNRMSKSIVVTGQDADLSACQHIVEGSQTMTVYKPVEELAKKAAQYAVALAQNLEITGDADQQIQGMEDLNQIEDTLSDGENDVPYVCIEPIAVTKENMDEVIIDSGFHSREEVYLNVSD